MSKLAHLTQNLADIRARITAADKSTDIRQSELDSLLDTRFNKVSDRLEGALSRLASESDKVQNKSLSNAVQGVVNAVSASHQVFTDGMAGISQEIALSHNILTDEIGKIEIDTSLADRIGAVNTALIKIPTQHPAQKEVDLSPVINAVNALSFAMPDIGPQLARLEQRMSERVYVFDIQRDPMSGTIDKIVVTEGAV